jgi:hypothetical protein
MTPAIATPYSAGDLVVRGGQLVGEGVYFLGTLAGRGIESAAVLLAPKFVALSEKVSLLFLNNLPYIKAVATLFEECFSICAIFLGTYAMIKLIRDFSLFDYIEKVCIVALAILLSAFLVTNMSMLFLDPFARPGLLLFVGAFNAGLGFGQLRGTD